MIHCRCEPKECTESNIYTLRLKRRGLHTLQSPVLVKVQANHSILQMGKHTRRKVFVIRGDGTVSAGPRSTDYSSLDPGHSNGHSQKPQPRASTRAVYEIRDGKSHLVTSPGRNQTSQAPPKKQHSSQRAVEDKEWRRREEAYDWDSRDRDRYEGSRRSQFQGSAYGQMPTGIRMDPGTFADVTATHHEHGMYRTVKMSQWPGGRSVEYVQEKSASGFDDQAYGNYDNIHNSQQTQHAMPEVDASVPEWIRNWGRDEPRRKVPPREEAGYVEEENDAYDQYTASRNSSPVPTARGSAGAFYAEVRRPEYDVDPQYSDWDDGYEDDNRYHTPRGGRRASSPAVSEAGTVPGPTPAEHMWDPAAASGPGLPTVRTYTQGQGRR